MPAKTQPEENNGTEGDQGQFGRYVIRIDGQWTLRELSDLSHLYLQVYALLGQLEGEQGTGEIVVGSAGRIVPAAPEIVEVINNVAISHGRRINYPWAGGWSSTNFYRRLVRSLRGEAIPRVLEIRYASPGFIALNLWLLAAAAVRRCINETAKTASIVHQTYDEIYRGMQNRKLLALDVRRKQLELSKEEVAFVIKSRKALGNALGLSEMQSALITTLSPGTSDRISAENEMGTIKVLLSLYRKLIGLSSFRRVAKRGFNTKAGSTTNFEPAHSLARKIVESTKKAHGQNVPRGTGKSASDHRPAVRLSIAVTSGKQGRCFWACGKRPTPLLNPVVRRFLSNNHIMHVAFPQTSHRNPQKPRTFL
jgi:hypothetical protein